MGGADKAVAEVLKMLAVGVIVLNGGPAATSISGLDLFIYQKFARWDRIPEKMLETVKLIDWANPIQVTPNT